MPSSKLLHRLVTRPADYMKFMATGRLPQTIEPKSPLITLLRQISPRDLSGITGVKISEKLGYGGMHPFHYGAQALRWIAPEGEQFAPWPAESWRLKGFQGPVYLEDFLECCAKYPADLPSKYPRLCRPAKRTPLSPT